MRRTDDYELPIHIRSSQVTPVANTFIKVNQSEKLGAVYIVSNKTCETSLTRRLKI